MGGVSYADWARVIVLVAPLQWGPPGMGGVSSTTGGRCTHGKPDFNGDLPEWEV